MSISPQVVGTETEYGISTFPRTDLTDEALWVLSHFVISTALGHNGDFWWPETYGSMLTFADVLVMSGFHRRTAARLYVDHAHPEYSAQEATHPLAALLYDKAGEWILDAASTCIAADEVRNRGHKRPLLYKNNTDGKGQSYAGHVSVSYDNRILRRAFTKPLASFFVVLQLLSGAGSIASGTTGRRQFWVTQRGRFFHRPVSEDTTGDRGIVNTRDESLDPDEGRNRMHVISQDVNMNEIAGYLKIGLIMVVMSMIEADAWPRNLELENPVAAFQAVAADPTLTVELKLLHQDRNTPTHLTAPELLGRWIAAARRFLQTRPMRWQDDVLGRSEELLGILTQDLFEARHSLDWVMKLWLLRATQAKHGWAEDDWGRAKLAQMDLHYHHTLREPVVPGDKPGIYYLLQQRGDVHRLLTDSQIEHVVQGTDTGTRADTRRLLLNRYPGAHAAWEGVNLIGEDRSKTEITVIFTRAAGGVPAWFRNAVSLSPTVAEFRQRLSAILGPNGGERDHLRVIFGIARETESWEVV
jgi:hypothetical protein